jgi:hypothetical protein
MAHTVSTTFPAKLLAYARRQEIDPTEAIATVEEAVSRPETGVLVDKRLPELRVKKLPTRAGKQEFLLYTYNKRTGSTLLMDVDQFDLDEDRRDLKSVTTFARVATMVARIIEVLSILFELISHH